MYTFDLVPIFSKELITGQSVTIPQSIQDHIDKLYTATHWMFALYIVGVVLAFIAALGGAAQQQAPLPIQDGQILPLWSGPAPGALGTEERDIPTITVYLPRTMTANTPAVIVCPGGGYVNLAMNHEGRQVASYLNSLGIAAFVLRYRLGPRYHHPIELGDAQRAIRTLRSHASEWRLDPARIGIMGFSAGGHLAMSASTHFDAERLHSVGLSGDFDD